VREPYVSRMRSARVRTSQGKFGQRIQIGGHVLTSDESTANGGSDAGPEPHEFLLAGLGACTSMTIKLYADRKEWPLRGVDVTIDGQHDDTRAFIVHRTIVLEGELTDEQRQRLLDVANKCPVHRTLTGTIRIETELA
jgi:putative redox protein